MKINIGSHDKALAGYTSVDLVAGPGIVQADLRQRWPFEDNSIEEVRASHIIEHLPDKIHTMNEAWRVLKNGGKLWIDVPCVPGPGAFADPTHVSFWNRNSFWYYEVGHPCHTAYAKSYGIKAAFRTISESVVTTGDGDILSIHLIAVKG